MWEKTEKLAASFLVIIIALGLWISADSEKKVQEQIESSFTSNIIPQEE